jgi:hypothetical protein
MAATQKTMDTDPQAINPEVPDEQDDDTDIEAKAFNEFSRLHKRLKREFPADMRVWIISNLHAFMLRDTKTTPAAG